MIGGLQTLADQVALAIENARLLLDKIMVRLMTEETSLPGDNR